jgi:hypothetical protein
MQSGERFLPLDTGQARLHLRKAGLFSGKSEDGLNECERAFVAAQIERHVDHAGPLAGHKVGPFRTTSDYRVLVTSQCRPPEAKKGATPYTDRFFSEMFADQTPYVLGWLKCARESLLASDFRPGQLFVLAGPSNCGKSLFQSIVSEWLGGRAAKPYRYFVGETAFNADLAAAEHLLIEDENASTDIRTRRNFGGRIKEFAVCKELSIHAKGRQAVTLPTFRRMTLSVNNEPENLMILPPLDASLEDKISLFKCSPATLSESREENWERFTRELPGLAWSLEHWRIPEAMKCPRFGVKAWHHPELADALSDLSPERRLLNLLDQVLFKTDGEPWTGTSEELEGKLRQSAFGFAADRLLYFPGAAGTYLGRLVKTERVLKTQERGRVRWTVRAP